MTAETITDDRRQPYVGMRAFRKEDGYRFFGRDQESHEVAALWQAHKLTVLYGTSGVGKTSLLQAGVIPILNPARFDVRPVGRISHGSAFPRPTVPPGNPYTLALLSSWSPNEPPARLAGLTIDEFLSRRGERTDRYGDPVPILVAIDQAEELFADYPRRQDHLEAFIAQLADALLKHQGLHLLLSLREDCLAAVLPYERVLGHGSRARFRLLPFGREAALSAARGPLRGSGRSFDENAAERLVDDLRTIKVMNAIGEENTVTVDTVEPVQLQVVCFALWESLPAEVRVITAKHVRLHADVDQFLANFCARALTTVARQHAVPASLIRTWLQDTFITELGTRGTAYEGLDQTAGMPNAVVRALEDRHILKAEHRAGTRWYELQHDRLIGPLRQADPAEHLQAAEIALADGDLTSARRHAEQALRTSKATDLRVHAAAEAQLGGIDQQCERLEPAQVHYRTAAGLFEVLQDSSAVGRMLAAAGRLSMARGHHSEAADALRAAIPRVPTDLTVQTELGWALWHGGQPHAALVVLNGVLAIEGNATEAVTARGEILADLGNAEEALSDLDRVRRHQRPSTVAARALALATAGRLDAAEEEAADAVANGAGNGPVLLRAARVRALDGDQVAAVHLVSLAIEATDPPLPPHLHEEAQRLLARSAAVSS